MQIRYIVSLLPGDSEVLVMKCHLYPPNEAVPGPASPLHPFLPGLTPQVCQTGLCSLVYIIRLHTNKLWLSSNDRPAGTGKLRSTIF